ncbi:hypothetical protein SPHINGO8BC_60161 [Sphingobacterium multivorum]|uniref:Uncharacterized protein n=1 Tax=Sphingobacterium multivorum TaxID=28454 RepID=A0A654DI87_SPHMU|nr:hypothetical protein SPHINGO8BC_60161 [Sphingobacterium multivorum]
MFESLQNKKLRPASLNRKQVKVILGHLKNRPCQLLSDYNSQQIKKNIDNIFSTYLNFPKMHLNPTIYLG